jgi:hypothetical protein
MTWPKCRLEEHRRKFLGTHSGCLLSLPWKIGLKKIKDKVGRSSLKRIPLDWLLLLNLLEEIACFRMRATKMLVRVEPRSLGSKKNGVSVINSCQETAN